MTTSTPLNGSAVGIDMLPPDADPELKGALQAMRRAAQRARVVAQQTGTDLIVVRDGKLVRLSPFEPVPATKP